MEELGDIIMMKDDTEYYLKATTSQRKQYKEDDFQNYESKI